MHRATERVGPEPCGHPAPCRLSATTELLLYADGTEEAVGEAPPPLCSDCPERESIRPRIRHIEVVLDRRNRHGRKIAPSAARIAHNAHDRGPGEPGTPQATDAPTAPELVQGDDIPAAWGPDHPARLALEGREPPPRRRPGGDGTIRMDPSDFGVT